MCGTCVFCILVCVSMCVHIWRHASICVGQRLTCIFFSFFSPYFWGSLSVSLEFTHRLEWQAQHAPRIYPLAPPSNCQGYRCVVLLCCGRGDPDVDSGPQACFPVILIRNHPQLLKLCNFQTEFSPSLTTPLPLSVFFDLVTPFVYSQPCQKSGKHPGFFLCLYLLPLHTI